MSDYLKHADGDWYRQRMAKVVYWVTVAFVVLFLRLFHLQVIEGEEFRRLSETNCVRIQSIEPSRGLIYDRNGSLLADNRPSFEVGITLKNARPVDQTLAKLSGYLNVPQAELVAAVAPEKDVSPYRPVVLRQDIDRDALAAVEVHKFDLPGVEVNVKTLRNYLGDKSAAHIIGYLSEISGSELQNPRYKSRRSGDFIGKFGVERVFEEELQGTRGGRQVEVNAHGQVVRVLNTVEAQPGKNVYLTIDSRLQQQAEGAMEGYVGALVAVDPQSGHVLAMVSSPSFDQNAFVSGMTRDQWGDLVANPDRPMENKVIQGEYPPASTFKIVTAIAGLEEHVIDEKTTFYCPGHYKFGNRVFRCWKKGGHGTVNVVRALEESCDVFFYQVGQKLGIDRLAWYSKGCGLGAATGVALDNEATGIVPSTVWKRRRFKAPWHSGETLSVAIGQGYSLTTPLQMAALTAAVANGGTRFRPLLMKEIRSADNEPLRSSTPVPVGRLPVSERTLAIVREGLYRVVNGSRGTARASQIDGIQMCGKTGTAQVVGRKSNDGRSDENLPDRFKAHAWFVAYAPAKDPKIAMAVLLEHGEHGSSAAPIARDLISFYLDSLQPEGSEANLAAQGLPAAQASVKATP